MPSCITCTFNRNKLAFDRFRRHYGQKWSRSDPFASFRLHSARLSPIALVPWAFVPYTEYSISRNSGNAGDTQVRECLISLTPVSRWPRPTSWPKQMNAIHCKALVLVDLQHTTMSQSLTSTMNKLRHRRCMQREHAMHDREAVISTTQTSAFADRHMCTPSRYLAFNAGTPCKYYYYYYKCWLFPLGPQRPLVPSWKLGSLRAFRGFEI